ncbi:MAG TPA: endonuclease III domain-containing protein [Syntrophales bacterium]|jgi:endonuclease-3 related protein|nr:endonuclease III domain-containing protein [Syntrophales bacterium]HON23793.1 endonuclease III domain-containing protein [Syntrophales bacterium]HOU78726.1 endonuclease III domain-containing protein [Syntrophales bacterium]HPC33631.1 endonuclease III domain-containing protein [Syntrophales bacterium]HQG35480.1 endonuclease III domain-containing protein [Syntrophales bacterium]
MITTVPAEAEQSTPQKDAPWPAPWIDQAYRLLDDHFGNLHWWPGESPLEVVVGAILTQNTAWANVEKAITLLKRSALLSAPAITEIAEQDLAEAIRPSGYYHVKARRLKAFFFFLRDEFEGSLEKMFTEDPWKLRQKLLAIKGIGAETADSILLYAGGKPVFVVDAYTRRILVRHGIIAVSAGYGEIQRLFMDHLPHDASLFNQYHALIVNAGKRYCRKTPRCRECPLYPLSVRGKGTGTGENIKVPVEILS